MTGPHKTGEAGRTLRRDHDLHHRRRARNLAVLVILLGAIGVLFWVTIVRLGGNAANPWS